jgi:outer membrane protein assembly factor BamB
MLATAMSLLALAVPIPDPVPTTLSHRQGAPATARPYPATKVPRNRYLARDPRSNIHNDAWMTDAYRWPGPLGADPQAFSGLMRPALCGSLTFHSRGYLVSVCPSVGLPPQARVIDPNTLDVRASRDLPTAPDPPGTRQYQNFAAGGYFFLDGRDRIWSATKTNHLLVLHVARDGRAITRVGDYDLTAVLDDDERISSALPDFKGRIWFVSKQGGKVGILNPRTRRIRVRRLNEDVQNSFAVDEDAVYVVSSRRMYRLSARRGRPRVDWRRAYRNSGIVKPGQADAGSGTTPTVMRGGNVAITDNADPMNVVVYRKRTGRVVCETPVFERGASATENSLITAGRSLFVENNHGYQDPFGPSSGALTTPGFARVDVTKRGCRKVWTNTTVRAPSAVPKLSTRTGLIYTYTREPAPPLEQPYFWTAIDARTGATAWKLYAGSGLGFNNNYAGLALGRDGTAYLGVIGGIVALREP